ncbi:MAG: tetratricopeptide repeat protein [Gammaproteobacteria bacterium]|nr:tetratricopeptide repeat protein [Gammaproteobacteria bacterium]
MSDSSNSPYIHTAVADSFQSLVLDNSRRGPVLVNFWSPEAGSCLQHYPQLGKLIQQYDGRVLLVNIDADKEVGVCKDYSVNDFPTLKLFRNERVVETLKGEQSEEVLINMLTPYISRQSDITLADAVQLFTEGKTIEAYEMIATAIVEDPVNYRLPLTLCKLLKHEQRFAEAIKLIDSLPEGIRDNHEIDQIYDLISFYVEADLEGDVDALISHVENHPDDLRALRQLAIQYVVMEEYEKALQQLVAIMEIDPAYKENYPQKAMLKIFNILGSEHELIEQYRPNLNHYIH